MEPSIIILLALAALCGGFTQGLAGFGSTLVALPMLALVMDLRVATPVCCLLAVTLNIILTGKLRGHIVWPALALLLGASLPGMAIGAQALRSVSDVFLKGALGLAVLAFVAHALRRRDTGPRAGTGLGLLAGFTAGCMGAAIGVNGPPVVAWISRQGYDRNGVRATLTAYFLLAGIGVVSAQYLAGLLNREVWTRTAVAAPALVIGLAAGMACCGRIGERAFSRVMLGVLGLSGVSLLAQAFWSAFAR
ncbi:sulfite exporter TauE/SafE family protein [Desulfovibrio sp. JY]|nr:sulfite exporter TauE/SafE family protein [Desulfovibrio sp. JY]